MQKTKQIVVEKAAKKNKAVGQQVSAVEVEVITEAADSSLTNSGKSVEIGGPKGLEPTRYGDWEAKGRCYDF